MSDVPPRHPKGLETSRRNCCRKGSEVAIARAVDSLNPMGSLRLDARGLDHAAPFLVIVADDLGEFARRGADHIDADGRHALLIAGCRDDLPHLAVERIDDVGWR